MQDTARHIFFSGRVQGVGFRFTAHRIAGNFGLTGFVRNLPDCRVEMLVQGSATDIEICLENIKQTFSGYIKETQIDEVPVNTKYDSFNIRF
jgi:acylphosphatase